MEDNKISAKQFMRIFLVAILSPATRMIPVVAASTAKHAGWICVLIITGVALAVFAIFKGIFRRGDSGLPGLGDVFELVFGKVAGKAIMVLYFIWAALIFLLYIRYYAERMLLTIFSTTDIRFFISSMMILVFVAIRERPKVLARFSEISALIFIVVLLVIVAGLLPSFKLKNVWPVTQHDIVPVLKGSFQIVGAFTVAPLFFFLYAAVKGKQDLWKRSKRTVINLGLALTLITILCIGTVSYRLAENMPMPFFTAVKLISVIESLDRIEALLFSVWVITDFVIIAALAMIMKGICKKLFALRETKQLAAPLALFGYVGGLFLSSSVFELESFSKSMAAPVISIVLSIIIPLAALIVGRARKLI